MATRSTISVKMKTGEIKSVYCHFDGYHAGVGKTLFENYQSQEKVESLVLLGALSSLGENIDSCVAYDRDRGEPFQIGTIWGCPLVKGIGPYYQEYNYYWDGNEWHCSAGCSNNFKKLSELFESL